MVFSNGRSAISFITDNLENVDQLPDVLLLDLNMPIMNGWEFIDEYRKVKDQLAKQIKIYIVTMTDVEDKRLTQLKEEGVIAGTIVKSELYQGNSILDAITG
mgnify:FL=1